jgi:formylglycine-generating enzyme required for sulfatase activity
VEISASLGDAATRPPTPCLTAIEARIACEVQGKRLPTPEEWEGALGGAKPADAAEAVAGDPAPKRLAMGEWTMRMVHGSPVFEVKGADVDVPKSLAATEYSRKVGLRCVYVYER